MYITLVIWKEEKEEKNTVFDERKMQRVKYLSIYSNHLFYRTYVRVIEYILNTCERPRIIWKLSNNHDSVDNNK